MSQSYRGGRITFSVLVFVAVYPLATGLSYLMQAMADGWDIWQRQLVVVPIAVLAMVFVIIPRIQRLLARTTAKAHST